jgi:hypothetical protein
VIPALSSLTQQGANVDDITHVYTDITNTMSNVFNVTAVLNFLNDIWDYAFFQQIHFGNVSVAQIAFQQK